MSFSQTIEGSFSWLEARSRSRSYPWILSLVLVCTSIFLAYPCFECFDPDTLSWEVVQLKGADPTNTLQHISPDNWLSKKVFRLTVPLIMSVTHLEPIGVVVLQYLAGYLMLVFMYKLTLKITQDPVAATLVTGGIVFLFFGRVAFLDLTYVWFDGFTFFFLIMAMYVRRPWAVFLFACAAAWNDERGFMALGLVFLFHQLRSGNTFSIARLRPNGSGRAVLIAIVSYLVLRTFLSSQYGMRTPTYGAEISYLKLSLPYVPIGTWTFLEGFWLAFAFTVAHAMKHRHHFMWIMLLAAALAAVVISGCVSDITRTGAYLVPVIFILVHYMQQVLSRYEVRMMLLASSTVSLFFPGMIVCFHWELPQWFQWPVFIEAARHAVELLIARFG